MDFPIPPVDPVTIIPLQVDLFIGIKWVSLNWEMTHLVSFRNELDMISASKLDDHFKYRCTSHMEFTMSLLIGNTIFLLTEVIRHCFGGKLDDAGGYHPADKMITSGMNRIHHITDL